MTNSPPVSPSQLKRIQLRVMERLFLIFWLPKTQKELFTLGDNTQYSAGPGSHSAVFGPMRLIHGCMAIDSGVSTRHSCQKPWESTVENGQ